MNTMEYGGKNTGLMESNITGRNGGKSPFGRSFSVSPFSFISLQNKYNSDSLFIQFNICL